MSKEVYSFSVREKKRINVKETYLDHILHHDTILEKGSLVLEAGCGEGLQTKIIAKLNPEAFFISVDSSESNILKARKLSIPNVRFELSGIHRLPFNDETFDSVFISFVLEHAHDPLDILQELKRVLKKNGRLIIIEGDHGSTYFFPDSLYARKVIGCHVKLQIINGGNLNIGRELYPLLMKAGFPKVHVSPREIYADSSKPGLMELFTKNTFIAMLKSIKNEAIVKGLIDESSFDKGIEDLYRTTEKDGVFCYTFFKAFACK